MTTQIVTNIHFSQLAMYGEMLSSKTRLRILWELQDGEKCVQDLAHSLQMSASAISHQLRKLRLAGMLRVRRDGKHMFYSFQEDAIRRQVACFLTNIAR